MRGVIISSFGDSFRVAAEGKEYICRARGNLRTKSQSPVCGDFVLLDVSGDEPVISEICPRKNEIIRPPLANLDVLILVCSTVEPSPNILTLDKFAAVSVFKGISPVIVFTKSDRADPEKYLSLYRGVFPVFAVDNITGRGTDELLSELSGKFSALTGNSGVGKSSLLNNLCPDISVKTGEISRKLGRGKHTTRRTEIYPLPTGGYIADTPGFAAFSTERYDIIFKDDLAGCFPEFGEYTGKCRFPDCSHTKEQGCAVLKAVEEGRINPSRHRSYCEMYSEASKIKPWELKSAEGKKPQR